jgi:hypothetical protein
MKKTTALATILLLVISLNAFTQTKDTTKKDTVTVVLVERTDTIRLNFTCTYPNSNVVNYVEGGYMVVKGLSKTTKKPYVWNEDPTILLITDDKRRTVRKIIQIH